MTHNYNGLFTYERIKYADEKNPNVSYEDCVLLQTIDGVEKGAHIDTIATTTQILGWNGDDLDHDIVHVDDRKGPNSD